MSNELLIGLIGAVSTFISGFTSWFFTRKKYNSEVDNTVINNLKDAVNTYKLICDDNKRTIEEYIKSKDQLEDEVRDLRKQVNELMMSICYDLTCSARQKLPRIPKEKEHEKH
jgi:capsular polysaccharide biosynthesis protein